MAHPMWVMHRFKFGKRASHLFFVFNKSREICMMHQLIGPVFNLPARLTKKPINIFQVAAQQTNFVYKI